MAESRSDLAALSRRLAGPEKQALDRLLTEAAPPWLPQPGPQADAYLSEADFLFYGGAAGGGKTDLAIGLALTAHRRSIVFRREYAQLQAVVDRVAEILGGREGYNAQDKVWRLPSPAPKARGASPEGGAEERRLEFGAAQHPGDERRFQGRPHDLKVFDEVTHFQESQFRFLCGWNRTVTPGQRCRVVATGNPPSDAEGEWVIRFWAPWLDPGHPVPAAPGELRWFAMLDGEDREVEGPALFVHKGEQVTPQSRTFIPSRVEDNLFLADSGYRSVLQGLPEPLRSQMLMGDFGAGREDDPWQAIPTAWIEAAQARWRPEGPPGGRGVMDALGVDVARGGRDSTVLSPRHGDWFGAQTVAAGAETPDGPAVAALVLTHLRDGAPVQIDIVGPGASVHDHLVSNGIQSVPMNGAEASTATDRSGRLRFVNRRAEWWWAMREALEPGAGGLGDRAGAGGAGYPRSAGGAGYPRSAGGDGIALPPDRALLADLAAPRWKLTARGIQVESKEEIVKRLGRSPDRGDAAVYALKATPRRRDRARRRVRSVERGYDPHGW